MYNDFTFDLFFADNDYAEDLLFSQTKKFSIFFSVTYRFVVDIQLLVIFGIEVEIFVANYIMNKVSLIVCLFVFPFLGCDTARNILNSVGNGNLTTAEAAQGLKEALRVGTDSTTYHLGLLDGFYKDDMIKILMPPEAQKVEKT